MPRPISTVLSVSRTIPYPILVNMERFSTIGVDWYQFATICIEFVSSTAASTEHVETVYRVH